MKVGREPGKGGYAVATQVPNDLLDKAARRYEYEVAQAAQARPAASVPRVICVSRQFGAGGRQVSQALGRMLGWAVWDKEILNVLAGEGGEAFRNRMFEAQDERRQGEIEALLSSLFGQADKHTYFYLLPKAICTIARSDAVILGRGAHLVLPDALKVFLRASMGRRVANLVRIYGVSEREAKEWIGRTETERQGFVQELARRIPELAVRGGPAEFDLEVCTDRLSFSGAAAVIVAAAEARFGVRLRGAAGQPNAA